SRDRPTPISFPRHPSSFTTIPPSASSPPFLSFNDPATTDIYTLSLHDALPISHPPGRDPRPLRAARPRGGRRPDERGSRHPPQRSEEHTSELQSRGHLVCRLLLEKKKKRKTSHLPVQPPTSAIPVVVWMLLLGR